MSDASRRIVVGSTSALVRNIAGRWREQYKGAFPDRFAHVQGALDELDAETATAAEVEAIIGNKFWTSEMCDICLEHVERWVQLGDEPDYESTTLVICEACLGLAGEALRSGLEG